jgi:hypothetical protein
MLQYGWRCAVWKDRKGSIAHSYIKPRAGKIYEFSFFIIFRIRYVYIKVEYPEIYYLCTLQNKTPIKIGSLPIVLVVLDFQAAH